MLVTHAEVLGNVEKLNGVVVALTSTELHEVVSRSFPNISVNEATLKRQLASGTPGMKPGLQGAREGSFQLLMEMAPPKFVGVEPFWSRYLKACGMKLEFSKKASIAASWTSGASIPHDSTFVADVTGATGRVMGTWYPGEDLFFIYKPTPHNVSTPIGALDTSLTFSQNGSQVAVVPLTSPGTQTNALAWHPSVRVESTIPTASVANGPIIFNAELLGATSGARGRCTNQDGINGAFALRYVLHNGSPAFVAGETINVVGGGASAVVAAGGVQTQFAVPSVSVGTILGGRRVRLKGARGTWSLLLPNKEQGIFTFDMKGVPLLPDDVPLMSFPAQRFAAPPRVVGGSLTIDGTYQPTFSQVQYSANTVVNMREDPGDGSLSGFVAAEVSDYAHQVNFDPEAVEESIYPFWSNQQNKTPMRLKHVIGSGLQTTFEIRQDHLQIDSLDHAERNSRLTYSLTADATSGPNLVGGGETLIFLY